MRRAADGREGNAGPRWLGTVSQHTLLRRPVSAARGRLGWLTLAVIVTGFGAFRVSTSDEAIRRRAERFLRRATGGEVSVGSAHFSMFGGITLWDVRVSTPVDALLDPTALDADEREIFSASSLKLIHDPWRLPFGLRVREIIATHPKLTIVQNPESERFNWQALFHEKTPPAAPKPVQRPLMRFREAEVALVTVDPEGRRSAEALNLDADVRPHPILPTAYLVDVRQYGTRPTRGRMVFDPVEGMVSDTPTIGLRTVRSLLPKVYQDFFARLRLGGDVRSQRLRYGGQEPSQREYDLELQGVSFRIPLSMLASPEGAAAAAADRMDDDSADEVAYELHDISGTIHLAGSDVTVDLRGRLNEAECTVTGAIRRVDLPLTEVGLDLAIRFDAFEFPRGALRRRMLASETMPVKLREFLKEFDPYGRVDLACSLRREWGSSGPVEFRGTLRARGAEAMYGWFPYRLRALEGAVRFDDDGIHLEGLTGRHGGGVVRIDGVVREPSWLSAVELSIEGSAVPLDGALYSALGEHYRRIWERFDPRGIVNASVRLSRARGDDVGGPRPWQTRLTVDLVDARACYDRFPYPLEHVRGRMRIGDGEIRFDGLTGTPAAHPVAPPRSEVPTPTAVVRVDGYALEPDGESDTAVATLELRIEARDLPLDECLATALPAEAREAFRQSQPSGRVNLLGRVFARDPSQGAAYDLEASLVGARLCYEGLPYAVDDMQGTIRILPDRLTFIDLTGRHGSARVTARGDVRIVGDESVLTLTLVCAALPLDEELRGSLPPALCGVWEMLSPGGTLNVTSRLHRASRGGQVVQRFRTEVELTGGRLVYRDFPLPLDDVRGRALITNRRVELSRVEAKCGDGTLRLSGSIDVNGEVRSGAFRVSGEGLAFDDALARAIPESMAGGFQAVRPRGRFDVALDVLGFRRDEQGRLVWNWDGRVLLRDASFDVGMDLKHVTGEVAGCGAAGGVAGVSIAARGTLARALLGTFDLRDLTFRAVLDEGSATLRLNDCTGHVYGGTAGGLCEVTFEPQRTRYALSMSVQDAGLEEYLNASRTFSKQGSDTKGRIYGRLFLRGTVGDVRTRQGGGEFFLRDAAVWKLPLMLAVFRVMNLAPDENAFHTGWVQFFLEGRTLRLTKIDLQGNALSLIGSGTMETDTHALNVHLLAGSPHRLRVPLLTELLEGAAREVFAVQVSGTPLDPRIESRPVRDLRRALEGLIPAPAEPPREQPR